MLSKCFVHYYIHHLKERRGVLWDPDKMHEGELLGSGDLNERVDVRRRVVVEEHSHRYAKVRHFELTILSGFE